MIISGSLLAGATAVSFVPPNGKPIPAKSFSILESGQIKATPPDVSALNPPGGGRLPVDIEVNLDYWTGTDCTVPDDTTPGPTDVYTYLFQGVNQVTPDIGSVAGGWDVYISGVGLQDATEVHFVPQGFGGETEAYTATVPVLPTLSALDHKFGDVFSSCFLL